MTTMFTSFVAFHFPVDHYFCRSCAQSKAILTLEKGSVNKIATMVSLCNLLRRQGIFVLIVYVIPLLEFVSGRLSVTGSKSRIVPFPVFQLKNDTMESMECIQQYGLFFFS